MVTFRPHSMYQRRPYAQVYGLSYHRSFLKPMICRLVKKPYKRNNLFTCSPVCLWYKHHQIRFLIYHLAPHSSSATSLCIVNIKLTQSHSPRNIKIARSWHLQFSTKQNNGEPKKIWRYHSYCQGARKMYLSYFSWICMHLYLRSWSSTALRLKFSEGILARYRKKRNLVYGGVTSILCLLLQP